MWLWLLMAVVGTSVAVERVLSGQHLPTDVVAGSLVGVGTGLLVPRLHRREVARAPQIQLTRLQEVADSPSLAAGERGALLRPSQV